VLSVVIPCLNEASNIPNLVSRLDSIFRSNDIEIEIIIVNDGSTDNTTEVIDAFKREHANIDLKCIPNTTSNGIYEGWKSGINLSKYEITAFMDGDLQNQPEDLFLMYGQLNQGFAHVIQGYRTNLGEFDFVRTALSKGFARVLRSTLKINLKDPKSGFIVGKKTAIISALKNIDHYRYPQSFIGASLIHLGYTVQEVPTRFDKRASGESFLKSKLLRTVLLSFMDIALAQKHFKHEKVILRKNLSWGIFRINYLRFYFLSMPLHAWNIRPRTIKKLAMLLESEKMSQSELLDFQDKKLASILSHAHTKTNWYKNLKTNTGPTSDVKILSGIPFLEKSQIRLLGPLNFMDLDGSYKMHRIATSGSTGSPLVIFADREQLEWRFASTLRALIWTGWRIGDRQYRLWHQKIGMTRIQAFKERNDAILLRRKFVPAFEFDMEKVQNLIKEIGTTKPYIVDGYAESLDYLSRSSGVSELTSLKVPAMMSSAQTLTEQTRKNLEANFQTKVYDKYGSREFSGIAYECGFGNWFHVISDSYIVEILVDGIRPASPGEVGEVVITDLNNRLFPMIRYRIGDLATKIDESVPCRCGRLMPRIGKVVGRTAALIKTPKGRVLPGTFFAHFFKDYENTIMQYQVQQSVPNEITLMVVKGRNFSNESLADVLNALQEFLDGMLIEVKYTDVIPLGRTGKRSPVISTLTI
jgi:phenylacetate-CoA ligase